MSGSIRARRARAGAIVYERFNQSKKGKGYALNFLFRTLAREGRDQYDAYFIFDADNLVDPNFVLEMNKVYDQGGYGAITCYRNSRNFGANWISAGYAIWFLREARFLNFPRMLLGTNCHVSGTGSAHRGHRVLRGLRPEGPPHRLLRQGGHL